MRARKKPVEVDVFKFDGDFKYSNGEYYVPSWAVHALNVSKEEMTEEEWMFFESGELYIYTLEGIMRVSVGDYIIKGVNGEFYPCKPDIFEKTYEIIH
ncbi:hypothetical protein FEZ48_06200 [Marinilactibacillus psychrotolerans]|uniref:Uncharacterized protein n=1 Tax=Marinilactibacillus psychrotolerans TaxID=191770 RepID=A0A5R9C3Z6_9LACT|nr:hypothetical protein [Marinilactibacillus psychrotolerans]TLQ07570.1 hypothetical protein FEZ48_06200 [Marinilactibacillus psychrotolerans]